MRITPVTVLAGPAGSANDRLVDMRAPRTSRIAFVRDPGEAQAPGACACCALADGLTRDLRTLHHARTEGTRAFEHVVVDATGTDPRAAIAALARIPLASLRFALSAVLATSTEDHLALALADDLLVKGDALDAALGRGLYAHGALQPEGWLDRNATPPVMVERVEPCRWEDVESALQAAQLQAGAALHRMKGLVAIEGEPGPRVVQLFGHTRYPSARLADWPAGPRKTRFAIAADALETAAIARILQEIPRPPP